MSLNRLFRTLRELIGADVEPLYDAPREGDVRDSQADNTLARDLLGFDAKVTLDEGLRRTVEWYQAGQK